MPRVHINLHDIDEIEDLEDQEDWEQLIGVAVGEHRDARNGQESRSRGERRFGGSEVVARKRADRRKTGVRVARRV
jgi:hypothetical protein